MGDECWKDLVREASVMFMSTARKLSMRLLSLTSSNVDAELLNNCTRTADRDSVSRNHCRSFLEASSGSYVWDERYRIHMCGCMHV